jgi:hypothetical protein
MPNLTLLCGSLQFRPESAVDKQSVKRAKQRHRAMRNAGELYQPTRQGFAAPVVPEPDAV